MAGITPFNITSRHLAEAIANGAYSPELDELGGSPLAGSGHENDSIEEIVDEVES